MIEPERILYYLENLSLLIWDGPETPEDYQMFQNEVYMFCHLGTDRLHSCRHPDWEQKFLDSEKALVDSGYMKPYETRNKKSKESWDILAVPT